MSQVHLRSLRDRPLINPDPTGWQTAEFTDLHFPALTSLSGDRGAWCLNPTGQEDSLPWSLGRMQPHTGAYCFTYRLWVNTNRLADYFGLSTIDDLCCVTFHASSVLVVGPARTERGDIPNPDHYPDELIFWEAPMDLAAFRVGGQSDLVHCMMDRDPVMGEEYLAGHLFAGRLDPVAFDQNRGVDHWGFPALQGVAIPKVSALKSPFLTRYVGFYLWDFTFYRYEYGPHSGRPVPLSPERVSAGALFLNNVFRLEQVAMSISGPSSEMV